MPDEFVIDHHMDGRRHTREWDRQIAELAERQHGRVARWQLRELGVGPGAIDRRLARGRLRATAHRGVYAVGHRLRSPRATWMEAVLAAGSDARLSYRAAGAHWALLRSGRVEVTVPRRLRRRRGIVFHHAHLAPEEVTVLDGIPITTVARTLFDVAAVLEQRRFERAVQEADHLRLYDERALLALLERHPGHRGAVLIRSAAGGPTNDVDREEFVDRFLTLVVEAFGLPRPERRVWIEVAGELREVDCVWREQRVMVELDGWAAHGTRHAYESDRARDRRFAAAGWRVIRVTWRQLIEEPYLIAADLAALLGYPGLSRDSSRTAHSPSTATSRPFPNGSPLT